MIAARLSAALASLQVAVYDNTALSGSPIQNATVARLSTFALPALHSAVLQGRLTQRQWSVFSLRGSSSHARMWVDDHLLIDASLHPDNATCATPGGDPAAVAGYRRFQNANMPTAGDADPHSMRHLGGDCTTGCSLAECTRLCDMLASQGCVGFVTRAGSWDVCYMRKLAGQADSCEQELVAGGDSAHYDSYTRIGAKSCAIAPKFCPPGGTPIAPPTAAYMRFPCPS
jgi:hypothetical protein